MPPPRIRAATAADLPAVCAIEHFSFTNPWGEHQLGDELSNHLARFLVAVGDDGAVGGYLLFWELGDVLELHKIAVHPILRRRGWAEALMEFLFARAREYGAERVVLEVRASNQAAATLYEKMGMRRCGMRRGYYDRPVEDAWLYEWTADPPN